MNEVTTTVIGIDVGGERKGFHAVALQNGTFVAALANSDPAVIVSWCRQLKAVVVAVDAPCGWSAGGASRLAERSLAIGGNKISCFARQRTHHGVREGLKACQRAAPRAIEQPIMMRQLLVQPRAIEYPFVEVASVCACARGRGKARNFIAADR